MEHRLLEYFLAVCEELHFTNAARKLGISQPTLSHQIRLLEEEVGIPLFHRVGKKNHLTEAGHILRTHSLSIFHELNQAKTEISELKGLKRGHLRIGCSGIHLLTSTIISFHQQYPGIQLSVKELATEETTEGLLSNDLDLGVVFMPIQDEQLESTPLCHEQLVLVISSKHELTSRDSIRLDMLQHLPVILLPRKFLVRQIVDSACADIGITLTPLLELSTLESLWQMTAQQLGMTILPKSYALSITDPRIHYLHIVDPTPHQTVGVVHRKNTNTGSNRAFIHHLQQHLQLSQEQPT